MTDENNNPRSSTNDKKPSFLARLFGSFEPTEVLIKITPVIFILVLIAIFGFHGQGTILKELSDPSIARGLITILIAIATVWIAMILALSAISKDGDDEKFSRGKDILTILVGILGTIIGYYFGAESRSVNSPETSADVQVIPEENQLPPGITPGENPLSPE